ncbi:MAG: PAC2 family protein [Actinobacteria bacterium]|nr:PAC2 family protein [Actinomycetota bacterium]
MSELYVFEHDPGFVDPPLILGLDGWIDAGLGAGGAVATLLGAHETSLVATFDTDRLLDHRARRPTMVLSDGLISDLRWPTLELRAGTDIEGNGVLLLVGAEPDHLWRSFTDSVVDLALELGVRMVVGLGAYPAPVPHTRPVQMSCTASTEELATRFGFLRGSLEVPAGVQAAIEQHANSVGIPSVGAWAQVPHYTAAMAYPAASLALIETVAKLTGLSLSTGELPAESDVTRERIDELVRGNDEHAAMVHALELQADSTPSPDDLPSGDELAAELERFLRDQPPGGTPG